MWVSIRSTNKVCNHLKTIWNTHTFFVFRYRFWFCYDYLPLRDFIPSTVRASCMKLSIRLDSFASNELVFFFFTERERFVLFSKGCFCFIQSDAERHFHLVSFFFVIFPFLCGRMNFQAPVEIGFTPTLVFFFLLSFSFFFFHISNSLTPFYSLCHREMRRFVLSLPSSARPMGKSYWTGNRWALIFCEISSRIHLCYTSSL